MRWPGNLDEPFGFSFDVLAQAEFREEADGLVLHFEKILAVHSVDVVHKGKLGGGILGLAANHSTTSEVKMFEKLGKKLKSVAPESGKKLGDAWTPQQFFAACEDAGLELDLKKKGENAMEDGTETKCYGAQCARSETRSLRVARSRSGEDAAPSSQR